MKKQRKTNLHFGLAQCKQFTIILVIVLFSINSAFSQAVGIGGDLFVPDSSSILEIQSTQKGVLFPRMTTAQRDSISDGDYGYSAALSLLIYNTTTDCYEFYAYGDWYEIACATVPFSCGGTLTDSRDSKTYSTVDIDGVCWMAENLAYLPVVHDNSTFDSRGTSSLAAYGVYGYDGSVVATAKSQANYSTYGVLYNWFAAMDGGSSCNGTGSGQPACNTPVQGICPEGWHLPSHYEYTALEQAVCNDAVNGSCDTKFPYDVTTTGWRGTDEGQRTATNESLWTNGTLDGNGTPPAHWNTSGFSVLPGGYRFSNGTFGDESNYAFLWSSTESTTSAWDRDWGYSNSAVDRDDDSKKLGFSVRCVRDN